MSNLHPSLCPFLCLHQALPGILTLPTSLENVDAHFPFFSPLEKAKKSMTVLGAHGWQQPAHLPGTGEPLLVHYWNTRGSFLPLKTYIKCDSAPAQRMANASKGEWRRSCAKGRSADGSGERSRALSRGRSPATGADGTLCNYHPNMTCTALPRPFINLWNHFHTWFPRPVLKGYLYASSLFGGIKMFSTTANLAQSTSLPKICHKLIYY